MCLLLLLAYCTIQIVDELIKIINFFGEIPPFLVEISEQFISLFQVKPEVQQAILTILQNSDQSDKA
ncbi:hypothetical protein [Bartonella sp. B30(2025)]